MTTYIGYDAHKRYSIFGFMGDNGQVGQSIRVDHGDERHPVRSGGQSSF
jgi:hypothetical protein